MQCAISGEVPKEPVISIKSGYVFEKSLITKYVSANKTCPITGEPLSEEDLLPVKGCSAPVKPRVPTATSIPGLINLFQNEWEASTLETYTLKQQLDAAKQELAHTLYRYDAACRVISRLTKERDEAREQLTSKGAAAASSLKRKHEDDANENADNGKSKRVTIPDVIPPSLTSQVTEASAKLTAGRKGRKKPAELASEESFKEYSQSISLPLHNSGMPGIKAMDLRGSRLLTGEVDGSILLSDLKSPETRVAFAAGHAKPVSDLKFHPSKDGIFVSAAFDGIIKVWAIQSKGKPRCTLENGIFDGPHSISLHPALDVLLSGGGRAWSVWDIDSGLEVARVAGAVEEALTQVQFHPDGRVMASGGDNGVVRFWDVTSSKIANSVEGHKSKITGLAFSNNG